MPFPTQTFSTLDQWKAWIDLNVIPNGNQEIIGNDGNITENAAVKFIRQSPLNWEKADVIDTASAVVAAKPVIVFTGTTPASLTWPDNIYNEYVFVNMTGDAIPLLGALVYYLPTGVSVDNIPANTVVNILKSENDLWVGYSLTAGGGGGSVQKEPKTYIVGTTTGAPVAGALTWQLAAFENSYVKLWINYGITNQIDTGNGSPFITKAVASDTLTIGNYTGGWVAGDILDYILITP